MYKAIDAYADSQSKSRLGDKGYLKGVVIDVLYDHFLSLHWDDYSDTASRNT